ncbi:MAG: Do family serine endopeptidase [candidate division NC10 bacterium]|nr:Do family serine endopeptidase [candidate division NC10 bacterium]MBI2458544.1 Do family serine endopeptidase [candidate division NC10 bacterium]MBI2561321.1 Do family serine endopeptidase [candidate division NC10 bacterium]
MLTSRWFKALTLALYALAFFSLGIYVHGALTKPATSGAGPARGLFGPSPASPSKEGGTVPGNPFVRVAELVSPAVVNISTVTSGKGRPPTELFRPFGNEPFFRDFFDRFFEGMPRRRQTSLGSGVIIDKGGLILTNNHVVKDADEITVRFANKQEAKGKVVGTDPKTDLAVIRVTTKEDLPVVALGNSDTLHVGEWAIAIGNPFGLDHTLTVGVISATGRSEVGIAAYENFIQTDASINPGNSGGPLLNIRGEVIGINTAIVASAQGIGFAIPVNMARKVMEDLVKKGKVTQGWLGVGIQSLTPELAKSFGVGGDEGILVNQVMPKSPAEAAGLKTGDLILSVDGKPAKDPRQLQRIIAEAEIGKSIELIILREKQKRTIRVQIGEVPAS